MSEVKLTVADSPHLASGETVPRAMVDVLLALVPITAVSIYFFRFNALFILAVCVATAVVTDVVVRRLRGLSATLGDGSVVVTGVLVALCFSPVASWWLAVVATVLAVGVAKELTGGLGWNRFNPAAFGRGAVVVLGPLMVSLNQLLAPLSVSFPMASAVTDAVTSATPLALLKAGVIDIPLADLFLAYPGGALAETSALALLLGGIYLVYRGHICWKIPVSMIATVFVLTLIAGANPLYHVLSGGLLLGAFFMATDWVTSPVTDLGRIVFGVLIGVLVVVFRVVLAPTEGVAFSILIMNALVPTIDAMTRRARFGSTSVSRTASS